MTMRAFLREFRDEIDEVITSVVGPFRTVRAARLMKNNWDNPHILCVSDAERIAKP